LSLVVSMLSRLPSSFKNSCRRCQKQITTRYHFSVLGGLLVLSTIHVVPGLRMQAAADSVHPCHWHQIHGSCCQYYTCMDGVPRGLEQLFNPGCCPIYLVSCILFMTLCAFITNLPYSANSKVIEKFCHLHLMIYKRLNPSPQPGQILYIYYPELTFNIM
jgi:hypothetical protein